MHFQQHADGGDPPSGQVSKSPRPRGGAPPLPGSLDFRFPCLGSRAGARSTRGGSDEREDAGRRAEPLAASALPAPNPLPWNLRPERRATTRGHSSLLHAPPQASSPLCPCFRRRSLGTCRRGRGPSSSKNPVGRSPSTNVRPRFETMPQVHHGTRNIAPAPSASEAVTIGVWIQ
jgi:hypothetical protein